MFLKALRQHRRAGASNPGENEKSTQHDRDRVQRMGQEQDELLDESHFDKQERKAEQQEICAHRSSGAGRPLALDARKRQQDEEEAGKCGLRQGRDQNQVAPFDEPCAASRAHRHNFGKRCPFEEVEIVGPVVRCRLDVKLVALEEGVRPVTE